MPTKTPTKKKPAKPDAERKYKASPDLQAAGDVVDRFGGQVLIKRTFSDNPDTVY